MIDFAPEWNMVDQTSYEAAAVQTAPPYWTREKPTRGGLYWFQPLGSQEVQLLDVFRDGNGWVCRHEEQDSFYGRQAGREQELPDGWYAPIDTTKPEPNPVVTEPLYQAILTWVGPAVAPASLREFYSSAMPYSQLQSIIEELVAEVGRPDVMTIAAAR